MLQPNRLDRRLLATAALLLTATLISYSFLGSFARMEADDYVHAASAAEHGLVGSVIDSYQSWSGRYAHLAAASLLWSLFGDRLPIVLPTFLIAALTLSGWRALRPRTPHALTASLAITCAFLGLLPEVSLWQGVYWVAGGLTYIPPLILWLVMAGAVERHAPVPLLATLAFIAAGFNETAMVVQVAASFIWWAYRRDRASFALLGGSLLGLAVLAAAPGNLTRSGLLARMPLAEAMMASVTGSLLFISERVAAHPLALVLALFAGSLVRATRRSPLSVMALLLGVWPAVAISLFPILFMSWTLPPRIYIISVAIIGVAAFLAGHMMSLNRRIVSLSLVVLAVWMLIGSARLIDVRLSAMQAYAQAWDRGEKTTEFTCLGQLDTEFASLC